MRATWLLCFVIAIVMSAAPTRAAVFRVGNDAACTHSSIQPAVEAAMLTPEDDVIRLSGGPYVGPSILILGLTPAQGGLTLVGGHDDCTSTTPTLGAVTTLGSEPGAQRILHILGSHRVVLRQLFLADSDGKGIDFRSPTPAELILDQVAVVGNLDGGIQLSNTDPAHTAQDQVRLTLMGGSALVANKTAGHGGGINCYRASVTILDYANIDTNLAGDDGGGIYADGCALLMQDSSVVENVAGNRGGGLFLTGPSANASLLLNRPLAGVGVRDNQARRGGGIALADDARAVLVDAVVSGNAATVEGGAFWLAPGASDGVGTQLEMRGTSAYGSNCLEYEWCNQVLANAATDLSLPIDQRAKPGAMVAFGTALEGRASANFLGTRIQNNRGLNLSQQRERSELRFNGALIINNQVEERLMQAPVASGGLALAATTIAGNVFTVPGRSIFAAPTTCGSGVSGFRVERSILWQPGQAVLPGEFGTLDPACYRYLLASDLSNLPASGEHITDPPEFINTNAYDYRLADESPAVDFAPAALSDLTRDGLLRQVDRPDASNRYGIQDLGAYEQYESHVVSAVVASGLGRFALDSRSVAHGATALFQAMPEDGWAVVWPATGTCAAGTAADTTVWRTGAVTADCVVEARFKYQSAFSAFNASPSPTVFGQGVTLAATLDGASPQGLVAFYEGSTVLGFAPIDANGFAQLTVGGLSLGSHDLSVRWDGGDALNMPAPPRSTTHVVNPAQTALTLMPINIRYGETAVAEPRLAVISPGQGTPSGSIRVSSGVVGCTIDMPETTCVVPTDGHGQFLLNASFSGGGGFFGSQAQATLTIVPQYVGGTVVGLGGSGLVLGLTRDGQLGRTKTIAPASTGFRFDADVEAIPVGAAYRVQVLGQPVGQVCSVTQGSGLMPAADVSDVLVVCPPDAVFADGFDLP